MTPGAASALKNLRDYMDDVHDSDPSLEDLIALRESLLIHLTEFPDSAHYAVVYLIAEAGEARSSDVKTALERMLGSSSEGVAIWSRALLYQLYGEERRLQEILEMGGLRDPETPGCLRSLYSILDEASNGDQAARRAVESLYRDPEVDSRVRQIILRDYYG